MATKCGRARVLGNSATIYIKTDATQTTPESFVKLGEVDKFTAKMAGEIKKSKPLGIRGTTTQYIHEGWELTFEGGRVDWGVAAYFQAQEMQWFAGGISPQVEVVQNIQYYDNTVETYVYKNVTLHDFGTDINGQNEDIVDKFSGFARERVAAAGDTQTKVDGAITQIAAVIAAQNAAAVANANNNYTTDDPKYKSVKPDGTLG